MQAVEWTPPSGTLGALVTQAWGRAEEGAGRLYALRARAGTLPPPPDLVAALRRSTVQVIAEVKRASPSKGAIAPGIAADAQAVRYVTGGAAAISVLTEPSRFGGSLDDLEAVTRAVDVPAIRKDFIVAPVQLWEARCAGAAGALLIARALAPALLADLIGEAGAAGITPVVEIRTSDELRRAVHAGATVIGVNNRDLETLVIDPGTADALIPAIPSRCIAIAESGMQRREDVARYARVGADAVLVGSMVSAAADPSAAVRQLTGLPRLDRA
ncbi:MAG: indole-3-glycerol phosphate synthase TrpC [Gemmatimonadaceae bacterium]|jgi:indole-3-glycerol phosphate synthase|nr:indole-3-glycerol phosphate synthase TrpC [Gemmatimonadaceae bacterium]